MESLDKWVEKIIINLGVSESAAPILRLLLLLLVLGLLSWAFFRITRLIIKGPLFRYVKRTQHKWDDLLMDNKVFSNLAHIVPVIIVRVIAPILFRDFEKILPIVIKLTDIYLIIIILVAINALLRILEQALKKSKAFVDKPVSSYFQLIKIILYIAAGILIISVLINKSPVYLLSALGAMTALGMLVFKDTILGFVASVQISANDMVRIGDWVEMPKFNADGDVIAINLNTVKVQNWDKTITTIPTYYFITDSFKNWRGMKETGGRRIKRSIYINASTVKYINEEDRLRYEKLYLLKDYLVTRQKEIDAYNKKRKVDTSVLVNGRRMTNIGVFRHYIENYLKDNKAIRKDMALMVRQMAMEDRGIPIEIYCFTTTTVWAEYEEIQSDIFDHLMAAVSYFDLEVFQQPSGSDLKRAFSPGIAPLTPEEVNQ
ncbi:MAG TPA: mechanosensitive ion channel [Bacteroidales bacterium]|nr:mechanosensitive ion channel [Bacteroidales bacterium]HOR11457.1 mechanosensitive ion channel [Bacteroidales bacterium]HPB77606.1 mechanosensitive ion channel [Bacteroidales bacterium]HPK38953.1 mechanosensitive ion channel [Bacteroidales bacterium]HQN81649.1 mechanosensitive ion channel [Bacteroidales bacterium]